jgi:hypothetical protein
MFAQIAVNRAAEHWRESEVLAGEVDRPEMKFHRGADWRETDSSYSR